LKKRVARFFLGERAEVEKGEKTVEERADEPLFYFAYFNWIARLYSFALSLFF